MTATAQLIPAVTLEDWIRKHVEFLDEHCWGPPPGAVAQLVGRLVDRVDRAHRQGLALPCLGPGSVLVTDAGDVRLTGPAVPGSAADRAADLLGLGAALFLLATGVDPEVTRHERGLPDQHECLVRLLGRLSVGNPCAAGLAPLVSALLHPQPARRPGPAALRVLLTGRPPRTGTVQLSLAAVS